MVHFSTNTYMNIPKEAEWQKTKGKSEKPPPFYRGRQIFLRAFFSQWRAKESLWTRISVYISVDGINKNELYDFGLLLWSFWPALFNNLFWNLSWLWSKCSLKTCPGIAWMFGHELRFACLSPYVKGRGRHSWHKTDEPTDQSASGLHVTCNGINVLPTSSMVLSFHESQSMRCEA